MASYDDNKNPSQLDALTDATIANGDYAVVGDVSDSGHAKGITWAHIKAALKAYFDTLYHVVGGTDVPVADGGTGASDAGTARTNLGLGSSAVRDVGTTAGTVAAGDHDHSGVYQPLDNELTALAGVTAAANKIPIFSGANTANTIDLKDEDNMASDSATAVPTQQSVKAYVDAHSGTPDHGALTGLSDDDHTQYSKADGTRDFSGIVGYDSHKTFASDTDIVDKKYVDDSIVASGCYTDEQAQDAVGTILTDSDTIDFTYTDATPSITAAVKAASLDTTHITAAALVTEADTIAANDNDTTIPTSAAVKAYADAVTPEGTAILSTGETGGTKFLREDGDNTSSWQTVPAPEGTAIKSTGETGGTKFLREDGDGTCSWQTVPAGSGDVSKVGTPVDNQIGVWTGDGTIEGDTNFTFDGSQGVLTIGRDNDSTEGGEIAMRHNTASPAGNDITGKVTFYGKDSGGNEQIYGYIFAKSMAVTDGAERGSLTFSVGTANTALPMLEVGAESATTQINGIALGFNTAPAVVTSRGSQDLVLQTGNATTGNITIVDGANGNVQINPNGSGSLVVDGDVKPSANDGGALGTTTAQFSDLFLAEGGVINWDNGDATLTQVGNMVTLAGADLTVPNITVSDAGAITLGENTSIDLDGVLSADGKYSGTCITGTAGAALAFGDVVYLAAADSRWELTDADAVGTAGTVLVGICVLAAAGDGSATKILLNGTIRADAKFPTFTVSAPVYIDTATAGGTTQTAPTGADDVVRVLGFALTADSMYFNPSPDHITHTG